MFQSTPHFSSEANLSKIDRACEPSIGFNPRLTSAARRTYRRAGCGLIVFCFNPRLTSAARRTYSGDAAHRRRKFQSTPHFSSEANADEILHKHAVDAVSIHASLQQRGELRSISQPQVVESVSIHASL